MSPETPNSSAETQSEKRNYTEEAQGLIAALSDREPLERVDVLKSFVGSVLDDAEVGKIKSSKGEAHEAEDIEDRLELLVSELNDPKNDVDPLLFIPSDGGLRAAFVDLLTTEITAQNFLDAISSTVSERRAEREVGAKATHDLGEGAVKSTVSREPTLPHLEEMMSGDKPDVGSSEEDGSEYDVLFDADHDMPGSVEAAAVRTEESEGDRLTRERRQKDQDVWNGNIARDNRGK